MHIENRQALMEFCDKLTLKAIEKSCNNWKITGLKLPIEFKWLELNMTKYGKVLQGYPDSVLMTFPVGNHKPLIMYTIKDIHKTLIIKYGSTARRKKYLIKFPKEHKCENE